MEKSITNPFWDRYSKHLDSLNNVPSFTSFALREECIAMYSYSITSPEALSLIKEHASQGIVEIGGGNGYWAYCLSQMGVNITCYDSYQWDYAKEPYKQWYPVLQGGPGVAGFYSKRALMLCWPPYKGAMAFSALKAYKGDTLIYIGEGSGGCTADYNFHEALRSWDCIDSIRNSNWFGIHDKIMLYRR